MYFLFAFDDAFARWDAGSRHGTRESAGSKRRHNNVQKFTPAEALASIRWSYIYADANYKLKKLRMDKNNVRHFAADRVDLEQT